MKKRALLLTLSFLLAFVFTGGYQVLAATAKENYEWYCTQCHGLKGTGDGPNARPSKYGIKQPDMSVTPRNHTSPKDMNKLSDEDIRLAIKDGGKAVSKSALMPPFGKTLTEKEIDELVKYLRKLCKCKGKE